MVKLINAHKMDFEILLKFPNWESGTAGFTGLESGKAFESGKGSGSQVQPYQLGPVFFLNNFDFYNNTDWKNQSYSEKLDLTNMALPDPHWL